MQGLRSATWLWRSKRRQKSEPRIKTRRRKGLAYALTECADVAGRVYLTDARWSGSLRVGLGPNSSLRPGMTAFF
jgi:hypothetical protein